MVTGALTLTAALSYGELAAMMPRAGGQYVYLREAFSPLWGFLYGWTLFLVIQTGTIAAVGVAFARFLGVLVAGDRRGPLPDSADSPSHRLCVVAVDGAARRVAADCAPDVDQHARHRLRPDRPERFTVAKTGALIALIVVGLCLAGMPTAVSANFGNFWAPRGRSTSSPGLSAATTFGLFVALCVAQTGSLFSSDAWNNITFTAGEVKDPRRNLPLALAFGTGIVTALYLLANVAYLVTLPLASIQHAPSDRVATATLDAIFPGLGATLMASAILISTFGCNNGLILAGARAYYAMARDGLFFRAISRLNDAKVPAAGLVIQGVWSALLVLPRTLRSGDRPLRQPLWQPARLRHLGGADLLHSHHRRCLPAAADAAGR